MTFTCWIVHTFKMASAFPLHFTAICKVEDGHFLHPLRFVTNEANFWSKDDSWFGSPAMQELHSIAR